MKKLCVLLSALSFSVGSLFANDPYSLEYDSSCDCWNWMVRIRGLYVKPDVGCTVHTIGGKVEIDESVVNEVDITYFFYRNFSLELIAAVTPHNVTAKDTSLGNLDLGSVWLLPPTLLLQYHFMPECMFSPYLGVGLNYTVFFNEKAPSSTIIQNIKYDNSFGWAFQAGVDILLQKDSGINFDVKKVYISSDVSINDQAVKATVDINPWIIGFGVFKRF